MIEIIAEAGVNHHGDVNLARRMVDAANLAQAGIVKFQTYDPLIAIHPQHSDYELLKSLALPYHEFLVLVRHCEDVGIEFLSTPGDVDSLKFLVEEAGVRRIKIGSDDMTYDPLIDAAVGTKLPLIISTGMATEDEVFRLAFKLRDVPDVSWLHCVSVYPCPANLANLKAINTLKGLTRRRVGYSDHTDGTLACVAAAARGAEIIEKHFRLTGDTSCADKAVSIDDMHLGEMIAEIRDVELMIGSGVKEPCAEEKANIDKFRKQSDGRKFA